MKRFVLGTLYFCLLVLLVGVSSASVSHIYYNDTFAVSTNWTKTFTGTCAGGQTSGAFTGMRIDPSSTGDCWYDIPDITSGIIVFEWEEKHVGVDTTAGHTTWGIFSAAGAPAPDGHATRQTKGTGGTKDSRMVLTGASNVEQDVVGKVFHNKITINLDNNTAMWWVNDSLTHKSTGWTGTHQVIGFTQDGNADNYDAYFRDMLLCSVTGFQDNCTEPSVPSNSSTIDLLVWDGSTYSNTVDELEDFTVRVNWTDDADGSAIPVGSCNVTLFNGTQRNNLTTTYNSSLGLWVADNTFNYVDHGSYNVEANCSHSTDPLFNNQVQESITVTNIAPSVTIDTIRTPTIYDFTDNVQVEYNTNQWSFFVNLSEIGGDGDSYYVEIFNNSGGVLLNDSGVFASQIFVNTSSQFFAQFDNPYNFSVFVNDSAGDITRTSRFFVVNDTTNPVITWIDPLNGTNYDPVTETLVPFESRCSDAALFRMNVTIYNQSNFPIYSNETSNIIGTLEVMDFDMGIGNFSSRNATDWYVFNTTCSDSHTDIALNKLSDPSVSGKEYDFADFRIEVLNVGVVNVDYERLTDRYILKFDSLSKTDTVEYKISTTQDIYDIDSDYCGHLVIGDFWIDFDPAISCMTRVFEGYALVTAVYEKEMTSFRSESVGELNVVTESRFFAAFDTSELTINWSGAGLECGEKYPDNSFNLSFSGDNLTNCVLHVNDFLYDGWDGDCENISVELNIGKNLFEMTSDQVNDSCTIWNDKFNKTTGDYLWLLIMIGVIVVLFVLGKMIYGMLTVFSGLFTAFLGFNLFAYHWLLGGCVVLIGLVIMASEFLEL